MTDRKLEQIAQTLYYGSIPVLVIDTSGFVTDYNLGSEALFGELLNGRRYSTLQNLLQPLNTRVLNGVLIPQDDDYRTKTHCYFHSPDLGKVRLTSSAVVCHDPLTNAMIGQILYWDVAPTLVNDNLHERYRAILNQQLIWDTYAWSYDRILPLMPYYQDVIERHAAFLTASCDGPIIDLGAGTGNLAERLIVEGRSVTAVDSSRAMLERLRSKQALTSVLGTRLTVLEARAESLPIIKDQSFAGVSLLLALFDMRSPESGLRSAVRILRPGGRIVVTDLKRSFQLEPILRECERQLRCLGLYEKLADDLQRVVRSNHDLAPGSRSGIRIEDVFDSLAAQGFQGLEMTDSHLGQCATVTGQKPYYASRVGSMT
jgi:ubiquinone/menaquinone biosynthesis C-methylase UbiE